MRHHLTHRRILSLLVMLAVMAMGLGQMNVAVIAQDDTNDATFATPEDAITAYIQALATGDAMSIMQTFAIEEMSENFRFDLYLERIRAVTPDAPAPADYDLFVEMNRAQFTSQLLFQTRNMIYGLLATDERLSEGQVIIVDSEETPNFAVDFIAEVNPERLASLEVMQIGVPYPDIVASERYQDNFAQFALTYGAEEQSERVVLVTFEDNAYVMGFTLLRYGDIWKINNLSSPLAGINAFGAPVPATQEAFDELISSEDS